MADDRALSLNDIEVQDIKKTRSGRVSCPRLAFWAGERLFTSCNKDEGPRYIPPKHSEKMHLTLPRRQGSKRNYVQSSKSSNEKSNSPKKQNRYKRKLKPNNKKIDSNKGVPSEDIKSQSHSEDDLHRPTRSKRKQSNKTTKKQKLKLNDRNTDSKKGALPEGVESQNYSEDDLHHPTRSKREQSNETTQKRKLKSNDEKIDLNKGVPSENVESQSYSEDDLHCPTRRSKHERSNKTSKNRKLKSNDKKIDLNKGVSSEDVGSQSHSEDDLHRPTRSKRQQSNKTRKRKLKSNDKKIDSNKGVSSEDVGSQSYSEDDLHCPTRSKHKQSNKTTKKLKLNDRNTDSNKGALSEDVESQNFSEDDLHHPTRSKREQSNETTQKRKLKSNDKKIDSNKGVSSEDVGSQSYSEDDLHCPTRRNKHEQSNKTTQKRKLKSNYEKIDSNKGVSSEDVESQNFSEDDLHHPTRSKHEQSNETTLKRKLKSNARKTDSNKSALPEDFESQSYSEDDLHCPTRSKHEQSDKIIQKRKLKSNDRKADSNKGALPEDFESQSYSEDDLHCPTSKREQSNKTTQKQKLKSNDRKTDSNKGALSEDFESRSNREDDSQRPTRRSNRKLVQKETPIPLDISTHIAEEKESPKPSCLHSDNTAIYKSLDLINNLNNMQPSTKKTVSWSDKKSGLTSKRNIFMTAISNASKLRSQQMPIPLKSALAHNQNNLNSDTTSVESLADVESKSYNGNIDGSYEHNDRSGALAISNKKGARDNSKKVESEIKNSTNARVETKTLLNGKLSKHKKTNASEKQIPNRLHNSDHNQKIIGNKKIKTSSESDEHHFTPRRQRHPKRKRLARAIIEDDSDSDEYLVESYNCSEEIVRSTSPEVDSFLLGLFSNDIEKAVTAEENAKPPISLPQKSSSETSSLSDGECDQFPDREILADSDLHENTNKSTKSNQSKKVNGNTRETSQSKAKTKSKAIFILSDESMELSENDIQEEEETKPTICPIADLFNDLGGESYPKNILSQRMPNVHNGKDLSKKRGKNWNKLKKTLDTHLKSQQLKTNPNKRVANKKGTQKPVFSRANVVDKNVPKAGTLKRKQWIKQRLDELNEGHSDDIFAGVNLPTIKPATKNLNMTEEASNLSLNFTTPRPKTHLDEVEPETVSLEKDENVLDFVTNKKLADACIQRREKRFKAKRGIEKAQSKDGNNPDDANLLSSMTPPALSQQNIKRAVENVNDMLSRITIAAKESEVSEASDISSDELEDYYFSS